MPFVSQKLKNVEEVYAETFCQQVKIDSGSLQHDLDGKKNMYNAKSHEGEWHGRGVQ